MRKTLIIGATSAIAQATARLLAEAGDVLFLVARNAEKLAATADDRKLRGAVAVDRQELDVLDYDRHKLVIDAAIDTLDGIDLVLIAHGTLPDQKVLLATLGSLVGRVAREALKPPAMVIVGDVVRFANWKEHLPFLEAHGAPGVVNTDLRHDEGKP